MVRKRRKARKRKVAGRNLKENFHSKERPHQNLILYSVSHVMLNQTTIAHPLQEQNSNTPS
jgi:hypothetical protein